MIVSGLLLLVALTSPSYAVSVGPTRSNALIQDPRVIAAMQAVLSCWGTQPGPDCGANRTNVLQVSNSPVWSDAPFKGRLQLSSSWTKAESYTGSTDFTSIRGIGGNLVTSAPNTRVALWVSAEVLFRDSQPGTGLRIRPTVDSVPLQVEGEQIFGRSGSPTGTQSFLFVGEIAQPGRHAIQLEHALTGSSGRASTRNVSLWVATSEHDRLGTSTGFRQRVDLLNSNQWLRVSSPVSCLESGPHRLQVGIRLSGESQIELRVLRNGIPQPPGILQLPSPGLLSRVQTVGWEVGCTGVAEQYVVEGRNIGRRSATLEAMTLSMTGLSASGDYPNAYTHHWRRAQGGAPFQRHRLPEEWADIPGGTAEVELKPDSKIAIAVQLEMDNSSAPFDLRISLPQEDFQRQVEGGDSTPIQFALPLLSESANPSVGVARGTQTFLFSAKHLGLGQPISSTIRRTVKLQWKSKERPEEVGIGALSLYIRIDRPDYPDLFGGSSFTQGMTARNKLASSPAQKSPPLLVLVAQRPERIRRRAGVGKESVYFTSDDVSSLERILFPQNPQAYGMSSFYRTASQGKWVPREVAVIGPVELPEVQLAAECLDPDGREVPWDNSTLGGGDCGGRSNELFQRCSGHSITRGRRVWDAILSEVVRLENEDPVAFRRLLHLPPDACQGGECPVRFLTALSRFDTNRDGVISPDELGILIIGPTAGDPNGANRDSGSCVVDQRTGTRRIEPFASNGVVVAKMMGWSVHQRLDSETFGFHRPLELSAAIAMPSHELFHLYQDWTDLYSGSNHTEQIEPGTASLMGYSGAGLVLPDAPTRFNLGWLSAKLGATPQRVELRGASVPGAEAIVLPRRDGVSHEWLAIEFKPELRVSDGVAQGRFDNFFQTGGIAIWRITDPANPKYIELTSAPPRCIGPEGWAERKLDRRGFDLLRPSFGGGGLLWTEALSLQRGEVFSDRIIEGNDPCAYGRPNGLEWRDQVPSGYQIRNLRVTVDTAAFDLCVDGVCPR